MAILLIFFRRLLGTLAVLLLVLTAVFCLLRAVPGGPFDGERELPPQALGVLRRHYDPALSLPRQYGRFLSQTLRGDLGPSFRHLGWSVNELLADKLRASFELGFYALAFAAAVGIAWGSLSALGSAAKGPSPMVLGTVLLCIPSFVLGPLLNLTFAHRLHWFNAMGWEGWRCKVLPTLTLGLFHAAFIGRLSRQSFSAEFARPYVRTARAKGLSERQIFFGHVFRNGLGPVIAYLGPTCAGILSGTFVVESCFNVPGLGRLFIESIANRDYTVISGIVLTYALLILLCNFFSDVLLGILDPRLRSPG